MPGEQKETPLQAGLSAKDEWFAPEQQAALSLLWRVCSERAPAWIEQALAQLERAQHLERSAPGVATEAAAELGLALAGEAQPLAKRLSRAGASLARAGTDLSGVRDAIEAVRRQVVRLLIERCASEPLKLEAALHAMQRLFDRALHTITLEYFAYHDQRMEEQRRFKNQALLRFNRLSESGVLGIMICDTRGNIREANDAFCAMVGYTPEELTSGAVGWGEMTPPEWAPLDLDAIVQLRDKGRTRLWEKEYFRKDRSRVPVLVGVAMLHGDDGVAFVLDISERKHAEELRTRSVELEAENRRIQEASRLKSEFLANMSHELRTPLNSIIGFADLLHDGEIDPAAPEHREFLGDILKSGRHLLQLINDVLDLAKIEAGKMDFRPEDVALSRLVTEVVDVLRSIAAGNAVELRHAVDPDVERVRVDPARLKQVLYNYLSNALKFTPPGGKVVVRVLPAGPRDFRIEVEDTGIGIDPKHLSRLFAEYEQLDQGGDKRHTGTGLGLALTKRIVEAQGGAVDVHSLPGKGSVFSAILPRRTATVVDVTPSLIPEHYDDAPLVLVIEDDARDRHILVRMLNGSGYSVETASTGQQALIACRERTFDAITLDLLLPDLTGLELLRRLRREGMNQKTPVVVVSIAAERGVVHGFSVHDFLQKPVDTPRLLESLSRAGVSPQNQGPVLVVDDDAPSLRLMQAALRKLGYAVECWSDAERALESAQQQQHLAVILDLLMPGVDGFEFLRRFRSRPENRLTPVIVWTTKDLTVEDYQRLQRDAQAVFEKGNGRPAPLIDELRSLISERAL